MLSELTGVAIRRFLSLFVVVGGLLMLPAAASALTPAAPVLGGAVPNAGPVTGPTLAGAQGLAVSGNYAYVTSYWAGELTVVDISNPANPQVVAATPAASYMVGADQVQISGHFAFVTAKNQNGSTSSNDNGTGDSLTVVDISNPLSPTVVGDVRDTSNLFGAYGVAVSGHYAFVASQGLLSGQPALPDTSKGSFSVIDLNNVNGGVVANIQNPSSGAKNNWLYHADAVAISGNYAYVTAFENESLTVVDISNPTAPVLKTSLRDTANLSFPNDVAIQGNYAFVDNQANWNSSTNVPQLAVVDISNPLAPKVVGQGVSSPLLNQAYRVRIHGNFAYLSGKNGTPAPSLGVVDISNPTVPRLAATYSDATNLNSVIGVDVNSSGYAVTASPNLSTQSATTYPPYPVPGTAAGSTEAEGTVATIQLDPTPIAVAITPSSEPANPTSSSSANFAFTTSDEVYSAQCSLDGATMASCSSPISMSYTGLGNGVHTFKVQVTDSSGTTANDSYTWTISGAAFAPTNTGAAPTISGTASAGKTLTASSGGWSGTPAPTFSDQWQHCDQAGNNCTNVGSGGPMYVTQRSDLGSTIHVVVTATNSAGKASATSAHTVPISGGPSFSGLPTVTGTASAGRTLTGHRPGVTGYPAPTISYRWLKCGSTGNGCTAVAGATKSTYAIPASLVGSTVRFRVQATNSSGTSTVQSRSTGAIRAVGVLLARKQATLRRATKGHGTLTITIKAASSGARFTQAQIALPKGLKFASSAKTLAKALRVTGAHGSKLRFAVHIKHGALLVAFKRPQLLATLKLASKALTVSAQFTRRHSRQHPNLSMVLTAAGTRKTTRAKVRLTVNR